MPLSRALLLKGLAGVTAVGTVGGGVVYREEIGNLFKSKEQLEKKKVNGKLETLGLEGDCRLDDKTDPFIFSKECGLDEGKLKKIKFSNKGEADLIVKGWPSGGGVKIKVERKEDQDISFSFTGITTGSEIKVFGDKSKGKIVLKSTPESKFTVKDGKLTKGTPNADLKKLNEQLGTVNAPIDCRFDEAESDTSVECTITEDEFKTLNFSNKGDGDLTVKTWPTSGTVKLKAEKDSSSPTTMSVSFTGLTSDIKVFGDKFKGKIVVKSSSPESKFKVEEGKLTKGTPDADLKKFNEQLGKVNAPLECRFDESETGETVTAECSVSKEDLKTMVFSSGEGDQTYTAGENFSGMKLSLKTNKELDGRGTDVKSVFLTFKDYSETVKLSKNSQEVVSLIKGTNPEFGIGDDNVMKKLWDDDEVATKLTLKECKITAGQNTGECTFDETLKSVNLAKSNNTNDFTSLSVTDTSNKFEFHKDQEGYNQGFKFVFKGTTVSGSDGSISLDNDAEYEFKWKIQNSNARTAYLVKKEGG